MDFIFYAARYLLEAGLGFGALFTVSAAVVWWDGRRRRAHYRYWNGPT